MTPKVLFAKTHVEISPAGIVHRGRTETIGIEADYEGVPRLIYRNGFADPALVRLDFIDAFRAA